MATTHFAAMSFSQPTNQCVDPAEMDNWVDFNAMPSPVMASTSQAASTMTSPTSTIVALDVSDDHQTPVAPSHEYARFKQQTGIPSGSMASLRALSESANPGFGGFSNSGIDDVGTFESMGSMTGIEEMEFGAPASLPAFFYPPGDASSQADDFVDPTAITKHEEAQANIRFYPGMHQQAALAKAQAQAQQQRQQQLIQQQQKREAEEEQQQQQHQRQQHQHQQQQQQRQNARRSGSHQPVDAHTEETIARVVNQIRQNSSFAGDSLSPNPHNALPHIAKNRRDEEEMDEDERLLNSEEGKKLSSKERRQLRNKVSARAFRSRRKEYISQLEGEVAAKASELNDLKMQNRALAEENARFRALAEKLLRHQAFHPFLDELSRDPALAESLSKMAQGPSTQSHDAKDVDPYSAQSQSFLPQDNQHVAMAIVPEPQVDFSSLNIGGNGNWVMQQAHGLPMFQQPQVFAVLEVPEPEPLDLSAITGKREPVLAALDEEKADYPELAAPSTVKADVPSVPESKTAEPADEEKEWDFPEDDDSVALYANTRSTPKPAPSESSAPIAVAALTEKPHFELVVVSEEQNVRLQERLEKMIAKLDVTYNRIAALTSRFNL